MRWKKQNVSRKVETTTAVQHFHVGTCQPTEQNLRERPLQAQENMTIARKTAETAVNFDDDDGLDRKSQKRTASPLKSQENVAPKKRQKSSEKKPKSSVQFNPSLKHLPKIDKSRLVRCKNAGCPHKTHILCPVCSVHLCICIKSSRNCFTDYHTILEDIA